MASVLYGRAKRIPSRPRSFRACAPQKDYDGE